MSYYTDVQYAEDLPKNAKKDLKTLFFDSFFKNCKKILDVGCSVGRIISIYPERINGIDIDEEALKIAKEKNLNVKEADINKELPFKDGSYDGVFCSQVIEHVSDPLKSMKEMKRCLNKEGKIVLVTIDFIATHEKDEGGFWSDYTHKTPFVKTSLKKLAHDAGFRKFRVYRFPGKGFRNLIRSGLMSKETWIKIEKLPFVWKGQDLVLEAVND